MLTARPFALLAMSAALGAGAPPMPAIRRSTRYEPASTWGGGDCPRCDGTRIARRTADGSPTPPHRCPECRKRS